jgi:hypothetical protein
MAKYVILVRFSSDAFHDPKEILKNLEELLPVQAEIFALGKETFDKPMERILMLTRTSL